MRNQTAIEQTDYDSNMSKCNELSIESKDFRVELKFVEDPENRVSSELKLMMLSGYSDASMG